MAPGALSATVRLRLPEPSLVARALGPEVAAAQGRAILRRRGSTLVLRLTADRPSSLRSQVNTWLRLAEVALRVDGSEHAKRNKKV